MSTPKRASPRVGGRASGRTVPARGWLGQDPAPCPQVPRAAWLGSGVVRTHRAGSCSGEGIGECDQCGSKSLPLALCRTCGWDFFVAVQPEEDQALQPWTWRRSTKDTLFLYDPPQVQDRGRSRNRRLSGPRTRTTNPVTQNRTTMGPRQKTEPTQLGLFDRNLDPTSLRLWNAGEKGLPGTEDLLRPVLLHKGRGTRCPVCSSRYGSCRYPDASQPGKLLRAHTRCTGAHERSCRSTSGSCWSSVTAARTPPTRPGSSRRPRSGLRLRRLVYSLLEGESEPHDLEWLVDGLHEQYVIQGRFSKSKKKDQIKREKDRVWGELLAEFVDLAPCSCRPGENGLDQGPVRRAERGSRRRMTFSGSVPSGNFAPQLRPTRPG